MRFYSFTLMCVLKTALYSKIFHNDTRNFSKGNLCFFVYIIFLIKYMFQFFLDADIQIFGGDINATPIDNLHQPYGMLRYTSPVLLLPVIPYWTVYTDNLHQPYGILRYTSPVLLLPVIPYCTVYTDNLHQPYGMLRYTSPVFLLPVIPYCTVYTDNLH